MKSWAKEHDGGAQSRQGKTIAAMCEIVLQEANAPLKPPAIADKIQKQFNYVSKPATIGTTLSREAKKQRTFYKEPGRPNTFGLLEWKQKQQAASQ